MEIATRVPKVECENTQRLSKRSFVTELQTTFGKYTKAFEIRGVRDMELNP